MALSDIRIFQWYQKYIVKAADLTNLQTWLRGMFEGTAEGAFGGAVLKDCLPSVASGLTVNIENGIAVSPSGRIVVVSAGSGTFASPVGNPARSLLVARPKLTDSTSIPEPLNPSNNVYLYKVFGYDLVVLNGTPAVNPSYPATQSDDIILCAVKLTAGQTTLTTADIDYGKIDRPRKRSSKVNVVQAGTYSISATDEVIEVDATSASGLVIPAGPAGVPGQEFTVVKTDPSANIVSVSGEAISGLVQVDLEDQWQSVTFYSNGTAYRRK